jgi:hypothetical protein
MLKMFVNHIIKTHTCFGHSCNSTKHGKRPPEDFQTIVTETCRGFNDVIYKHFKHFSVLNVNVNVFLKGCVSWIK